MSSQELTMLGLLCFVAALLYSMVGHGGASGYLAAMALVGMAPAQMKPTALALNILVAGIGTFQFARAGYFRWRTFWPFALASVPLAFVGGSLAVSGTLYRRILGVVLLFAAWRLLSAVRARSADHSPPVAAALPLGAGIGLLSGLTGVGGGIFLSPLLLMMGWSDVRTTAAVSAAFILANSISGLLGHVSGVANLPHGIAWLALPALAGGLIGSRLGSRHLAPILLRRLLAVVLVVAASKLLLVRG